MLTSPVERSGVQGQLWFSVKMASALLVAVSWLLLATNLSSGLVFISPECMQCLCEAVSGVPTCTFNTGCQNGVCGPYSITFPYWQDSGRPTVGLEDRQSSKTYENCALDKACAEASIQGYMNKFHQDCNGDRVEDCYDYAAIHFHGGYGCNKPLSVPAKNTLDNCLQRLALPEPPPPDPEVYPQPNPGFEVNPQPNVPDSPQPEEPYYPDSNNVIYPKEQTTFPSIDIRFGE